MSGPDSSASASQHAEQSQLKASEPSPAAQASDATARPYTSPARDIASQGFPVFELGPAPLTAGAAQHDGMRHDSEQYSEGSDSYGGDDMDDAFRYPQQTASTPALGKQHSGVVVHAGGGSVASDVSKHFGRGRISHYTGDNSALYAQMRRDIDAIGKQNSRAHVARPLECVRVPFDKRYTPGPGAYRLQVDRNGRWKDKAFTFGSGDRSFLKHYAKQQFSPGPVYKPLANTSLTNNMPRIPIGTEGIMSRFSYQYSKQGNDPFWNPSSAHYYPKTDKQGKLREAGKAASAFSFPVSRFRPPVNGTSGVMIHHAGQLRENLNVFSPGPAYYREPNPDASPIRTRTFHYSLRPKCTPYLDLLLKLDSSPGPVYKTDKKDRKGGHLWGDHDVTVFGTAGKFFDPELNLHGVPYLSEAHARAENFGIHSPGPVFDNNKPKLKLRNLNLGGFGPRDRFYDRFEPGRLQ